MLDALDRALLNELSINCRTSFQKMAEKHGMSATAVKKRVEKLIDAGVLSQFVVEYNLAMINGEFFLALVQTDSSVDETDFIQRLGQNEMIAEVGALTGGQFIIFGTYIGIQGLDEVEQLLHSQEGTQKVEIHTLLSGKGKKSKMKKLHLRILEHLLIDPRMPVARIAKKTGLAARTVTRAIDEILASETVRLSIRLDINATNTVAFLLKVQWDETTTDIDRMDTWLRKAFPVEFWESLISANDPIMFPAFLVENLKALERISGIVQQARFVKSTTTLLGKPSKSFPDLRRYRLEESIKEAHLH